MLVGKPEQKGPLEIPWRIWEDNIKTDLKQMVCDDVDWINMDQDRVKSRDRVNTIMNLQVL
jgi:hypothetical protein